ncbi:hypothetical protein NPIL_262671 [Nephila pilipes]|uniref:Uncharacterized protein n=1 Tax=Nephila pilipes TaxID=299642 RepID=A0A8X6JIU8_NEPPI|nr:hypothetical protein NPIL_262671 [Nephila pilipes]
MLPAYSYNEQGQHPELHNDQGQHPELHNDQGHQTFKYENFLKVNFLLRRRNHKQNRSPALPRRHQKTRILGKRTSFCSPLARCPSFPKPPKCTAQDKKFNSRRGDENISYVQVATVVPCQEMEPQNQRVSETLAPKGKKKEEQNIPLPIKVY